MKHNHIYIGLVTVCAASLLFVSYTLYHHITYKNTVIQSAKNKVELETTRIVSDLDSGLSGISSPIVQAANEYSQGTLSEKDLIKLLDRSIQADTRITKIGLILSPAKGAENTTGRASFYERRDGKVRQPEGTETPIDYSSAAWYSRALASGPGWDDPVFDDDVKYYTAAFSVPIYGPGPKKRPAGVIYMKLSLSWLKEKMDSLNLEKSTFGLILTKSGVILYHPIADMVYNRTNIFDQLEARKGTLKNFDRQRIIMQKAVRGESGEGYNVSRTGQSFWYFYRPIKTTGWSLVVRFMKEEIPVNGKAIRNQKIRIAIGMIFLLTAVTALFLRLYDPKAFKPYKLWYVSIVFSACSIGAASYTWYLAYAVPISEYQQNKTVIDDAVALEKFLTASNRLFSVADAEPPAFIPTGIHIQTMEFSSSNNIAISGYIWQRFTKGAHDNLPRGFTMPEAKSLNVSEAYRISDKKEEIIGWRFEATIREEFDYSKYPFDHPNISVWLRPTDFVHNITLIPDIKGYKYTNASALPGLQTRLALPGYIFAGTFFSLDPRTGNTNFGKPAKGSEIRYPELYYNILIKRNFITPLVSKFFPVLIVISMLFIVMLSFTADAEKQKNFGLTGLAVVGLVVSFFFSTLLTQIDLRQQFNTGGIIFIENFNFITYLVLLLSAVQAFLFAAGKKIRFIKFEHCLIPKVLYWPVFTGLVLFVSLVYFF